jgi:hypothetical protein
VVVEVVVVVLVMDVRVSVEDREQEDEVENRLPNIVVKAINDRGGRGEEVIIAEG